MNEKTAGTKKEIAAKITQGVDQSLEQALYCSYNYVDCFVASRCQDCNLANYGRDCNNNEIDND